jgi:hypothetical protein
MMGPLGIASSIKVSPGIGTGFLCSDAPFIACSKVPAVTSSAPSSICRRQISCCLFGASGDCPWGARFRIRALPLFRHLAGYLILRLCFSVWALMSVLFRVPVLPLGLSCRINTCCAIVSSVRFAGSFAQHNGGGSHICFTDRPASQLEHDHEVDLMPTLYGSWRSFARATRFSACLSIQSRSTMACVLHG